MQTLKRQLINIKPRKQKDTTLTEGEYIRRLDQEEETQNLGEIHKRWSLFYEIATVSRITQSHSTIINHLGRGQQPMLKVAPALKYTASGRAVADA